MGETYDEAEDGEWVEVRMSGRQACCECGLAHDYRFRVVDGRIQLRVARNNRATAQIRRHLKPESV